MELPEPQLASRLPPTATPPVTAIVFRNSLRPIFPPAVFVLRWFMMFSYSMKRDTVMRGFIAR
jgi:hypothetical protein